MCWEKRHPGPALCTCVLCLLLSTHGSGRFFSRLLPVPPAPALTGIAGTCKSIVGTDKYCAGTRQSILRTADTFRLCIHGPHINQVHARSLDDGVVFSEITASAVRMKKCTREGGAHYQRRGVYVPMLLTKRALYSSESGQIMTVLLQSLQERTREEGRSLCLSARDLLLLYE